MQTNSNHPIIVGSPKLFTLMNDITVSKVDKEINGETIAVRQVVFNNKTIELVRFGDVADVKQGLATGDNKNYLYQNIAARGSYRDVDSVKEFLLNEKDLETISKNQIVRLKIIENGIHKTNFETNFDKDCYFDGRYIAPYDKGGEGDTSSGWLPNYYVPTNYFIDWSQLSVNELKTLTSDKQNGKIASRIQNKKYYYFGGLTWSDAGQYSPTIRLSGDGVFDVKGSKIVTNLFDINFLNGILTSKFIRFWIKSVNNHTISTQVDDFRILCIPIDINDQIIVKVKNIIEKQKKNPRYNYFANEQKEIDLLVYELYGLNDDDINEVETWFARRYPKLAKYAYYKTQKELTEAQLAQDTTNQKLLELIAKGESKTVEFKSTLRYCLTNKTPLKKLEHSAFKNLAAFLNSEGGTLFIGVDDDGTILGLEATDFASFKGNNKKDEFVKHFDNLVQNYFGNDKVHKFKVELETIEGKTIAIVHIKDKATSPVMITNSENKTSKNFMFVEMQVLLV